LKQESTRPPERSGHENVTFPHAPAPLIPDMTPAAVPLPDTAPPIRVVHEHSVADAPAPPTEVHVHIGRIEVTAPPSSPRAARRSRDSNARASMTLSDYLVRRRSS
jgi:hypothetical protein